MSFATCQEATINIISITISINIILEIIELLIINISSLGTKPTNFQPSAEEVMIFTS